MTYQCRECRAVFSEPWRRVYESSVYGSVEESGCPVCGDEDYTKVIRCPACGELFEAGLRAPGDSCGMCRGKARAALAEFAVRFSSEMLEVMDEILTVEHLQELAR